MAQGVIELVDAKGRKYLTAEERERFFRAAVRTPKPEHQTFALTVAHSGARLSEVLALRPADIDLDASAIRIRTLKRRAEHWREVPLPAETLRALELVHGLRSVRPARAGEPLWPWSRATGHRRIVAVMEAAGISGPQACPKGLRHAFGVAAVTAGVPLPTIAAILATPISAPPPFTRRQQASRRARFYRGCGSGRRRRWPERPSGGAWHGRQGRNPARWARFRLEQAVQGLQRPVRAPAGRSWRL